MGVCIGHEELGVEFPSYMKFDLYLFHHWKGDPMFDATLVCRDGPDAEYEYAREPSEEVWVLLFSGVHVRAVTK